MKTSKRTIGFGLLSALIVGIPQMSLATPNPRAAATQTIDIEANCPEAAPKSPTVTCEVTLYSMDSATETSGTVTVCAYSEYISDMARAWECPEYPDTNFYDETISLPYDTPTKVTVKNGLLMAGANGLSIGFLARKFNGAVAWAGATWEKPKAPLLNNVKVTLKTASATQYGSATKFSITTTPKINGTCEMFINYMFDFQSVSKVSLKAGKASGSLRYFFAKQYAPVKMSVAAVCSAAGKRGQAVTTITGYVK